MAIPPQFIKNKKGPVDSPEEDKAEGPEDGKPDAEDLREGEDFKTGKKMNPAQKKAAAKKFMLMQQAKGGK